MERGTGKMNKLLPFGFVVLTAFIIAGCEWEGINEEESWNTNVLRLDFSGTYRGTGPKGYMVSDPAFSGGAGDDEPTVVVVQREPAGTAPAAQTELSGNFPADKIPIVPGSVTIVMMGAISAGAFRDDGSGGLNGTFNLVGIDAPAHIGTGTIDYDTGAWTLALASPGFLEPVNIYLNWSYTISEDAIIPDVLEPGNSGDPIYSFTVIQTGNLLVFYDSEGAQFEGQIISGAGAAADPTGMTSGEAIATYQVTGVSQAGYDVTITGTFQGVYEAPSSLGGNGRLDNRIITGTWVESAGKTGDVQGASDESTAVATPTTAPAA
jgi:hypothetical protein